jgi:hypothetical protein
MFIVKAPKVLVIQLKVLNLHSFFGEELTFYFTCLRVSDHDHDLFFFFRFWWAAIRGSRE